MSFSVLRMNSAMVVGLVKRRNANLRNAKPRNSQLIKAMLKDTMFGIVMPRNTKLSNAKRKNAGLRMESFSCFIIHGNCILFEFMASFSS